MLDRVPYEIFSKIIKSSYRHFSYITFLFDVDETSLPPIEATHVCRSWRTALLSDPTMWTCIKLKFTRREPSELREMFSRSGSAPLDVFIEPWSFNPSQFNLINILPYVFQEMHRFRKLHMRIPTIIGRVAFPLLKQPAPMLQKFYLDMQDSSEEEWPTLQEAYQNLFHGNAPNLKHVHLQISTGLKELQSVSPFKNLSTLHLSFVSSTVIDGDILLDILHSSPCLHILDMSYLRPTIICSAPANYRVSLPYLQKLTLQGSCEVDKVDFILGRLDFLVDRVSFDITCYDSYPNISDSTSLPRFLAQRPLSLLSISPIGIGSAMVIQFFEQIDLESPTSGLCSKESSVLKILHDHYAPSDALSKLLQKFKMLDITHMYLGIVPADSQVLRRIFPLLKNLQHLRARHGDAVGSSSYLEALVPNNEADRRENLFPCPSLHTLEVFFSRGSEEFEEPYFQKLYYQKLVQCCKIREHFGYPFGSISIFCECRALAESVEIWLQANELTCSHVEVRIIASEGVGY